MNFFISDTEFENKQRNKWGTVSKIKNKFGKWYYRFEDCQVYKTDTRLIIYSGYTAEKTINEYIKTDPYSLKYANGNFCVAILEKETVEIFADYFCQTKFIEDDLVHIEEKNKIYMMPLTSSNPHTFKITWPHWINKHNSFDVADARWQEAKSDIQDLIAEAIRKICALLDTVKENEPSPWAAENSTCKSINCSTRKLILLNHVHDKKIMNQAKPWI